MRKFAVRKIREKEKNKKIHIVIAFSVSAQGDFSCYREMTCRYSEAIEIFERQEGTAYKLSKQHEFRRSLVDTRQIT